MPYITLFTVTFYTETEKEIKEHGILYATSYADAAAQIESYYGEELTSLEITLYADALFTYTSNEFHNEVKKVVDSIL